MTEAVTSDTPRKVLNVGQCGLDGPAIAQSLRDTFGCSVVDAESVREAGDVLDTQTFDLVLVNRILDATGEEGLELIRRVGDGGPPVMMISNYADAQDAAEKAGGVRGFGKQDMGQPAMLDAVRPYLCGEGTAAADT